MPSTAVINALGAVGGGVLAACLAPQLYKLWVTKSARDLSYLFLALYNVGLTLTFIYLYYEDALVAWICLVIELAFGCLMVVAKVYLDNFGPNSPRGLKRARPQARLTNSLSFASEVRIDVRDFAAGKVAPFPLLCAAPTHAAQHLLLDAQLSLPVAAPATAGADIGRKSAEGEYDAASKGSEDGGCAAAGEAPAAEASAGLLPAVGEMLEAALAAAGLPVLRRQAQALPSFRRQSSSSEEEGAAAAARGAEEAAPDMLYFAFRDGYCTAIWYHSTATLSLDLLAASDAAVARMGDAAQQLCKQLLARWPGSRIAASSVSRLPRAL